MNANISRIKTAITDYKNTWIKINRDLQQVKELYGEEAYKREYDRQAAKITAARESAVKTIGAAYADGVAAAKRWGRLDGSKLTDDIKLLDADIVTIEDFDGLKEKYQDNATMLMALKRYGERKNAERAALPLTDPIQPPYLTKDIATITDRLFNWEKAKAQALDIMDMIDGRGNYADDWNKTVGAAFSEQLLEHFGEGGAY